MRASHRPGRIERADAEERVPASIARPRALVRALAPALALIIPAQASALPPEIMDKAAGVLAIVILVLVPVGGIALFWMVHVLPEKIAEKRHHPQKEAIHTLCLLSLVFDGLLWPLAWLWAYTKPVLHQAAYGRDKHDDYYAELEGESAAAAATMSPALPQEIERLRAELAELERRGELQSTIRVVRERLTALERRAETAALAGGNG
jgi:hypothetical protein